jgi:pimeloyl-ACP methyl ester carboxylesterase
MQYEYKDTKINYAFYDNKSDKCIIFLHGWGQNIDMMLPIAKPFIKKFNVLIFDLPGFGKSEEPKEVWSVYDYADMVNGLVKKLKINNPIMVGHSFGGKITIAYATKYKTRKIVLLASPYRVSKKKPSVKTKILKGLKKVPVLNKLEPYAKKHLGSTDYRNASEMMRKILVNHVNLDLTNELSKIDVPTLLIWGTNDTEVPYNDAVELEKIISNCGLVTYEGCTHYAYLERLNQTINILKSFIGSDEK